MSTCPICKKSVLPRAENEAFPFCSERCKLIDLGHWLDGTYRVPGRAEEEEDEEGAPAPPPEGHDEP